MVTQSTKRRRKTDRVEVICNAEKLSRASSTARAGRNKGIHWRGAVSRNRRQRARPCVDDELQYKTFDTNDPCELRDADQRYPPRYDSTIWARWKQMERRGRKRKEPGQDLGATDNCGLSYAKEKNTEREGKDRFKIFLDRHSECESFLHVVSRVSSREKVQCARA